MSLAQGNYTGNSYGGIQVFAQSEVSGTSVRWLMYVAMSGEWDVTLKPSWTSNVRIDNGSGTNNYLLTYTAWENVGYGGTSYSPDISCRVDFSSTSYYSHASAGAASQYIDIPTNYVNVSKNPSNADGSVSSSQYVSWGTPITISASDGTAYLFNGWSDGVSSNSRTVSYSGATQYYTANFKLREYAINYNVNTPAETGGTIPATPATQTKQYGVGLALRPAINGLSMIPPYNFVCWNDKSDGTGTDYQAGSTYTGNEAKTLYAKWSLAYQKPKYTAVPTVYRCDSSGTAKDDGSNVYVEFPWKLDETYLETLEVIPELTVNVYYKLTVDTDDDYEVLDITEITGSSTTGGTGTYKGYSEDVDFDIDQTYNIKIVISDNSGQVLNSTEYVTYISTSYFIYDVSNDGQVFSFGVSAKSGLEKALVLGGNTYIDCPAFEVVGTLDNEIYTLLNTLGWKNECWSELVTISSEITNGTTRGLGTETYTDVAVEFYIVPNSGYALPASITVTGASHTYNDTTGKVVLSDITGDITVTSSMIPVYQIDTSSISHVTVTGAISIASGSTATITIQADEGYYLKNATVTGATATQSINQSTETLTINLSNPTGNVSVANCIAAAYNIDTLGVTNSTVSGPNIVVEGRTATLTITPDEGYCLPPTITVTNAGYTYNQLTGVVVISNTTDNVSITAESVIPNYLCFTAEESGSTVGMQAGASATPISLEYSTDKETWQPFVVGTTTITLSGIGDKVYLRGINEYINWAQQVSTWNNFVMTGKISASGSVTSLLDNVGTNLAFHRHYQICGLFYGCTSLTTAPELPSTTLYAGCYFYMFNSCSSLTTAPELPATTLATECYAYMFKGAGLTEIPTLPATTLAYDCYHEMFSGCTSITSISNILPATTLAERCYYDMFKECSALQTVPQNLLQATTLESDCYRGMFYFCTRLTTMIHLPATTLAESCYKQMFYYCLNVQNLPSLPATVLPSQCYREMFSGITSTRIYASSQSGYTNAYRIPSSGTATSYETDSLTNMFQGASSSVKTPSVNTTYYSNRTSI